MEVVLIHLSKGLVIEPGSESEPRSGILRRLALEIHRALTARDFGFIVGIETPSFPDPLEFSWTSSKIAFYFAELLVKRKIHSVVANPLVLSIDNVFELGRRKIVPVIPDGLVITTEGFNRLTSRTVLEEIAKKYSCRFIECTEGSSGVNGLIPGALYKEVVG